MANPIKGEVGFSVEGQDYTLLLDLNALCEVEDHIPGIMNGAADLASLKAVRALFWGGLQEHHAGITMRDAGRLVQALGLADAAAKVAEAMKASWGDTKSPKTGGGDDGASPQKRGRAGTGKTS